MSEVHPSPAPDLAIADRFRRDVLAPLRESFVGKETIVDVLGASLVAGENLFILGPPGTAKSAMVHALGERLQGKTFEYLLTRFTEPNELFGPFDIRKLREGTLETNTEGMLPEASLVFLDELLNANSAILNSLLAVLNERVFRRGRETVKLPLLMAVGASNHLPEEEALRALFDRFLLRVRSDNVPESMLGDVLEKGWSLETGTDVPDATFAVSDVQALQGLLPTVDLTPSREAYLDLVATVRRAGIALSDRRAVKLQRLVAASAILEGRPVASVSDLWVFRHIWDIEEQREVLEAAVASVVAEPGVDGAAVKDERAPDPERIQSDLTRMAERLEHGGLNEVERSEFRDRIALLNERIEWVRPEEARRHLAYVADGIWKRLDDQG